MNDIFFEAAEITGIEHKQANQELLLTGKVSAGSICRITFQGVDWWELCSFGVQNRLSSIKGYDATSLTQVIIIDQDLPDYYVRLVQTGPHQLFVLHASIGLSGWIIALSVKVDTAVQGSRKRKAQP